MDAPHFSVHVDEDDLAERDMAAAMSRRPATGRPDSTTGGTEAHHGARDGRQAARGRSEQDHARTATTGKARSYAFRRS